MMVKAFKSRIFLFCTLFAIGLLSRLPGVSFHSLWFDETSTANMVAQPSFGDMLKAINTIEGTPPLFFYIERAFISGLRLPMNEVTLRLLPMLFGALSGVFFFLLIRQVSTIRAAILSFVLFTVSNFQIHLAHDARCYSFFGLLALLSLYLTLLWWKRATRLMSALLFVTTVLLVQTHYYAPIWVCALSLAVITVKPKDRTLLQFCLLIGAATCCSMTLILPLFLSQVQFVASPMREYLTAKWLPGLIYTPVKVLIGAYLFKIYSLRDITTVDLLGVVPVIAVIGYSFYALYQQWKAKRLSEETRIIIVGVVFAFAIFTAIGWKITAIHPRYMAHFLVLLLGIFMVATANKKYVQMGIFVLLFSLNIVANIKYYDRSLAYIEPWKEVAEAVEGYLNHEGCRAEPIIADMMIAHTIAFYTKNKCAPIYQLPSNIDSVPYTHTRLFGHDYFAYMFHYHYYPIVGYGANLTVMREKKKGVFICKERQGHTMTDTFKKGFNNEVDLQLLRYFKTNQGDVCIYRWQYTAQG